MIEPSNVDEQETHSEIVPRKTKYHLPKVSSFEDVDNNFDSISDMVAGMVKGIEEQAAHTNENLVRLAAETSQNLDKLAADMKSILSSQTMVMTICIILICFVIFVFKGAFDFLGLLT